MAIDNRCGLIIQKFLLLGYTDGHSFDCDISKEKKISGVIEGRQKISEAKLVSQMFLLPCVGLGKR